MFPFIRVAVGVGSLHSSRKTGGKREKEVGMGGENGCRIVDTAQ